jgi:hypothetical protein
MPQKVTLIRVFVASPEDVSEERASLLDVIRELNQTTAKSHGIRLELVTWETDSYPSAGTDSQAVINEQISDDYDILIGILWKRLGSPTPRAQSGTAEEFSRAYARFQRNPGAVRIMFYFKESAPVALADIDPDQLKQVRQFQEELKQKGILYGTYPQIEGFRSFVRIHLSQHIGDFGKKWGHQTESAQQVGIGSRPSDSQAQLRAAEDEGLFELGERQQELFKESTRITQEMSEAISRLGNKLEERAQELRAAGLTALPPNQLLQIVNRAAQDMDAFSDRMELDVPRFAESYSAAIDAFGRAAAMLPQFGSSGTEMLREALAAVSMLKNGIAVSLRAVPEFRNIIMATPPMTTAINRAKRRVSFVLDGFFRELTRASETAAQVEAVLDKWSTTSLDAGNPPG